MIVRQSFYGDQSELERARRAWYRTMNPPLQASDRGSNGFATSNACAIHAIEHHGRASHPHSKPASGVNPEVCYLKFKLEPVSDVVAITTSNQ